MFLKFPMAMMIVFFCSVSFAESITLQTYYPAPQGNYRAMRSGKMCVGASCQKGDAVAQADSIFVAKGIQLGTEQGDCDAANVGRIFYDASSHDVMVCTVDKYGYFWNFIGASQADIYLGGFILRNTTIDLTHNNVYDMYNPKRISSANFDHLRNMHVNERGPFYTPFPYPIPVTRGEEPSPGRYYITYGGGYIEFQTGVEYKVELWSILGSTLLDSFIIKNDNGIMGGSALVPFPQRRIEKGYFVVGDEIAFGFTYLQIFPQKSIVETETIIGHSKYTKEIDWVNAGKPQVNCHLIPDITFAANKCYATQDTHTKYIASYDNVASAFSYATGYFHTKGFSLGFYRER